MTRSEQLFEEAARYIPGGVNNPLRSFAETGQTPRFIRRADESRVYDVDGHVYIDFVCSGGAALLGHNPPLVRKAVLEAVQNGLNYEASVRSDGANGQLCHRSDFECGLRGTQRNRQKTPDQIFRVPPRQL